MEPSGFFGDSLIGASLSEPHVYGGKVLSWMDDDGRLDVVVPSSNFHVTSPESGSRQ